MARLTNPYPQFIDSNDETLSGAKLYFYEAGTLVAQNTFSDSALSTANANPVVADAAGGVPDIYLTPTALYRVIINRADGTLYKDIDNVASPEDTNGWPAWSSTTTYNIPDIVVGSDGNFYKSIQDSNLNQDPTSTAAYWAQVDLVNYYNANVVYAQNDIVLSGGIFYRSRVNSNTGNTPSTSPTQWAFLSAGLGTWNATEFTSSGTFTKPVEVSRALVLLVGAGGGAGGIASNGASGGGGGGEVRYEFVEVTDDITVTIGAGGAGGALTPAAGSAGGNSTLTVGATLTALGGGGGGLGSGAGTSAPSNAGNTGGSGFSGSSRSGGGGAGAGGNAPAINGDPRITPSTRGYAGADGDSSSSLNTAGGPGKMGYGGGGCGGSAATVNAIDGGAGTTTNATGAAASANTGGGGGGVLSTGSGYVGGAGGSGYCVIYTWEFIA